MRRFVGALLLVAGLSATVGAQIIPRLPGARPATPAQQRPDTTKKDSTEFKFPEPDSITRRLLEKPGYSTTRYFGDTAFFNNDRKSLDLLAGAKRPAVVERDSTRVVSDSGIYYVQATRHVTSGGSYVITPPAGTGQAEIRSTHPGRVEYDISERSLRINNASLPVNNGEVWYLTVRTARVDLDSTSARESIAYIRGGTMTSCDDSIPDYTFRYNTAKRIGNTIVTGPTTMYVKDVPVAWLPFLFTDQRPGRHSGILPPQFGLNDIVRSSPTYHRSIEHLGYYWAASNYFDFATWLDWRSGSGGNTAADPGWLRVNADWNYKWLDRFLGGRVGLAKTQQGDGNENTAVTWTHQQDFGRNNHLNSNVNYVTSTNLQRQNTINPYAALATIQSQVSYQSKIGPASLSLGATRKQYPGRQQVDQSVPTISLSTTAIGNERFNWTPSFSFSRSDVLTMDQPGIGQYIYRTNTVGLRDSVLSKDRSSANVTMSFDTPITIFGWTLGNSFRVNQQRNNFPQQFNIYDVETGELLTQRVFSANYHSDVDYTPTFTLPSLGHNRFNLTPSVSLANVDPGPLWVASERTNGKYVSQSKRVAFGLSASPTLFGFFPGFGPFLRIRHALTPTVSWSYAPSATVSDEYLAAFGRTRKGYLGSLAQNSVSLGLTQNFEAKVGSKTDTLSEGTKVRLLSINMSSFTYDFERASNARSTGNTNWWSGLSTETFNYSLNSELLPGFDFSGNYSLFQGSTLSDTAKFAPYLTGLSASFNISRDQNPFAVFARLFGKAVPAPVATPRPGVETVRGRPDDINAQAIAAQPVAGSTRGGDRYILPPTQGWRASIAFSRTSPRPPVGNNVIDYDPRARCIQQVGTQPLLLDACLANQRAQPTSDVPVTSQTAGVQAYKIPPTTSVNGDLSFNLTPHWAAHWTTTYDVEHHEFASHIVQLQRDLHDWRAIFGFTQSPNGNFGFNFMIALKAEPDIKFDYNRATVRGQTF